MNCKQLVLGFLFVTFFSNAQYSIQGTISPNDSKLTWAMLYQIKEGRQHYIKNTKIKNQKFEFKIPATSEKGMYRVVYRLKDEGFVDFLFNKENTTFSFDPSYAEGTTVFEASDENKVYQAYLRAVSGQQQYVDSLQVSFFKNSNGAAVNMYRNAITELNVIQKDYEQKAKGKLAYHFIKATKRYNSETILKSPQEYLKKVKNNFFQNIDFNDDALMQSSFLVDRVTDYVFYINYSKNPTIQEGLYKSSIAKVLEIPKKQSLQKDLIEILVEEFVKLEEVGVIHHLFESYYDKLPKELQKEGYKNETLAKVSVVIGTVAPEIVWKENKETFKLSELKEHKNYIVVFWSTGCSHCKEQLPEVYRFLKNYKDVQVIAISLEDKGKEWKSVIPNFKGWRHVLGLNKWENKIARAYDITGTPTYFVLDADKVIVAKPKDFRALIKAVTKLK